MKKIFLVIVMLIAVVMLSGCGAQTKKQESIGNVNEIVIKENIIEEIKIEEIRLEEKYF